MSHHPVERGSLESTIVERAANDPSFRQALIADPRGTLSREYGVPLPDDIELTVIEETPKRRFLVLPLASTGALTDEQLEGVAGGSDYSYTCTGGCN